MCGIVGYVGPNRDGRAQDVVMEGLARLEYRGYDSAGLALIEGETDGGVASGVEDARRGVGGFQPQRRNSTPHGDEWLATTTMEKRLAANEGSAS